nr:hypothetical protein Iba_chr12cCG21040 [Ipomoea batatas]
MKKLAEKEKRVSARVFSINLPPLSVAIGASWGSFHSCNGKECMVIPDNLLATATSVFQVKSFLKTSKKVLCCFPLLEVENGVESSFQDL